MFISILIAAGFLVATIFIVRGIVAKSLKLGGTSTTVPRFNKRQRLLRMAKALAAIGCIALIAAYSHRPTPYDKLIPAAGRVTRIVTVSERLARNSSAAPSSINPFTPHDWVELTVEPTAPASLKEPVTWRVNTIADDDTLRHLQATDITARVTSLAASSTAYEVTTSTGQPFSTYADIATFERRGMIFFLCVAGFFLLLGLVMYLQASRTSSAAA